MRVLVLGAGVIGSVYAAKLIEAGNDVTVLARGRRLADLQSSGLVLENAESGERLELPVRAVRSPEPGVTYELVLVPVRSEQVSATLPTLTAMTDGSDVLFFGNTAGRNADLVGALGARALFGFPAAGGTLDAGVVRYVLIKQQKTMLGEPGGEASARLARVRAMLDQAGFAIGTSAHIDRWLIAHAAFVVPIACALYRCGTDAARLAADREMVRTMVRATKEAFRALGASGNAEIPNNLMVLYLWMPESFAVRYWRRVLRTSRGELWFAAHSRAAEDEMRGLARDLLAEVHRGRRATPTLDRLLQGGS